MTQQLLQPPRDDGFPRKKWTVRECRKLVETGLLDAGKYELVEGEIISKMGQSRLHIAVVSRILKALIEVFSVDNIQTQAQIGIGELEEFNDPEPDVTVLAAPVDTFVNREPDPATEVLLVVEASKSTLPGDSTVKARIYARNGVREYWVVAIPTRELIVFRQPVQDGYAQITRYSTEDEVAPLALPDARVRVADLLP